MNQIKLSRILSMVVITLLLVGCAAPASTTPTQEVSTATPTQTITPSPIPTHTSTPSPTATQVPTYTPTPTDVPLTATAIAAGSSHTCAVTDRGGVMCWGYNGTGQLGDGTTATRLTPVDVVGLTSGVVAVIAKSWHTCALTIAGGVKCWGGNWDGELGDGTTEHRLTPVDVVGLTSGVVAISTGGEHTCALTTSGSVKCWGDNGVGQLGDGTTEQQLTPVDVVGLTSGVVAVSAGYSHTCAISTSGGVRCWGFNDHGQLGDGTTTEQQLTPVDVVGLTSGVVAISAGGEHTCALTTSGGVKCWGINSHLFSSLGDGGQLGDGTTEDRLAPVQVVGLTISATAIAAGDSYSCALTTSGGVKCWGDNAWGQLGDGTTEQRLTPVQVEGLIGDVVSIDAGAHHTCVIMTTGGVKCWGANDAGQLGDGSGANRMIPRDVEGLTSGVAAIDAGINNTCALNSTGELWCWGDGHEGSGWLTPSAIGPTGIGFIAISTSGGYSCSYCSWTGRTCGLASGGDVWCTGDNAWPLTGTTTSVVSLSTGNIYTCVLTTGGGVKCWGSNQHGQLGDGTTALRLTPVDVLGLTSGISAVTAGLWHTCALTTNGGVKCWGWNDHGQLGDSTTEQQLTPVDVVGLTSGVVSVSAGYSHTCAISTSGGVRCWGFNDHGQLGDGTTEQQLTPVDVVGLTSGVVAVSAGGEHTCALTTSGGVKCWGGNMFGQLGDGTSEQRLTPVDVLGLTNGVAAVAAGEIHTCALTESGNIMCWGAGAIGRPSEVIQTTPVDVVGFGPQVGINEK